MSPQGEKALKGRRAGRGQREGGKGGGGGGEASRVSFWRGKKQQKEGKDKRKATNF